MVNLPLVKKELFKLKYERVRYIPRLVKLVSSCANEKKKPIWGNIAVGKRICQIRVQGIFATKGIQIIFGNATTQDQNFEAQ